jgi:hypothetical protein
MVQNSWAVLLGAGLLALILVGPGATVLAGWMWREEILANLRHQGDVNMMD